LCGLPLRGQVFLEADGPGNTYSLLSSVLGGTAYEVPDCSHPAFGPHIAEAWDATLGKYVFVFYIHAAVDNDRCVNFDRQRNEIKTYGPSPAYLKGSYGDLCTYRWKFKLDAGFQPSPNFTHVHQIKAGDGTDADSPIITITPRSASPERVELIYNAPTGLSGSGTKTTANLSGFKGQWVEAFEQVLYATNGTYQVTLKRISDSVVLLAYTNNNLNLWRGDATFNRPKWGIYRSLISSNYLRDEAVLFADFCLAKGSDTCPDDAAAPPPFTLALTPSSVTVRPGSNTNCSVTVATNSGFAGPVTFALSGLPPGATASFNPPTVDGAATSILTITASSTTPLGTSPLTVIAAAPALTNRAPLTLVVGTNTPAQTGLVAWLTFEDSTADDSSGYDNNGVLVNGAAVVADPTRGRVLSLDGVAGYVDLGNDPSLNLSLGDQATVATWVKTAASKNHNTIVSKGEWKDAYSLLIKGDSTPKDLLWTGNDTSVLSASPVPTNVWTHVAVTINSNLTTFYLNGQVSGATNQNRGNPIDNATNNVCLGREQYSGSMPAGRWFFYGLMDDVRIYARALTGAEIAGIVADTLPPVPRFGACVVNGSSVVLSGTNGLPYSSYYVLAST
jgi:hypothetical protein